MGPSTHQLCDRLAEVVGQAGCLSGQDIDERYCVDWMGNRSTPAAVVRPRSPDEVSRVVCILNELRRPFVPQGGMTGLVQAGLPAADEVVVSLERLDRVESIDDASGTALVQSGVILQKMQEATEPYGLFFPVDLGARGAARLGGMISTNAGGNRVLRYGMTRASVLGIEAVLPDGTVVSRLRSLQKDNAGYDLKQLFIGTEGTLGIITRAVVQLQPRPSSTDTALIGVQRFADVMALLKHCRRNLGPALTSFEAMWDNYFSFVTGVLGKGRRPFTAPCSHFVLVETSTFGAGSGREVLEQVLAAFLEQVGDAEIAVAASLKDASEWWSIRDSVGEAARALMPFAGFDVSIPLAAMEAWVAKVQALLEHRGVRALQVYGHLGDGNLHLVVGCKADDPSMKEDVYTLVHRSAAEAGGSISAEHGIGIAKKAHLGLDRSGAEIALMQTLKRAIDPHGLLSPGRVFDMGGNS